jgi:hypothetical protein
MSHKSKLSAVATLAVALASFAIGPSIAFAITGGNQQVASPRTCKPGTSAHRVRGQHGHWVWTCRHKRHSMGY